MTTAAAIAKPTDRRCDGCGRLIVNAVKVHLGKAYCRACYQVTFKEAVCSKCGGLLRQHRNAIEKPVCPACIRTSRRCVRCNRLTPRAGIRVGAGVACGACAPHFRDRYPCDGCGELSSRLSRTGQTGDAKLCQACRRRVDHATCGHCRRYRPMAGTSDDGKPLCKSCLLEGSATHPCPTCASPVAGVGVGRCRPCLNADASWSATRLAAASIQDPTIRNLFEEFGAGMIGSRCNDIKLKVRIEQAAEFFVQLAIAFPNGLGLDATSYQQRIDSKLMRRHLLASKFVSTQLGASDDSVRHETIEARRLNGLMANLPSDFVGRFLQDYAKHLKSLALTLRTQRLYLHAAQTLLNEVHVGHAGWAPPHLLKHLRRLPGHAASLSRFVTYCREVKGWNVAMPAMCEFEPTAVQRTERQVAALRKALAVTAAIPLDQLNERHLTAILSPSLGLSVGTLRGLIPSLTILRDKAVQLDSELIIRPEDDLHPYAIRWALMHQLALPHSVPP